MNHKNKDLFPIIASFAAIYIIWGSTYLFSAIAIEHVPPYFMTRLRFVFAALILLLMALVFRKFQYVSWQQLKNATIAGILLLTCGTASVAWALKFVDTGFTALIISGQPLLVVFLMWIFNKRVPPAQAFIGVFLGIIGMLLLVSQQTLVARPGQWKGIIVILLSMLGWGLGSIFVSKSDMPKPQMMNNAIQMLTGGISILLISFLFENPMQLQWSQVPLRSWGALAYLVVFGAIIVFTAFNYLLTKVTPDKVATSTYVNPIIALILGWWILNEAITGQSIIAAIVMLSGAFLINSSSERSRIVVERLKGIGRKRV